MKIVKIQKKKYNKICVVEDIADQWSIENSNIYKGYFHILGGTISSAGQRKEDLLINSLVERVKRDKIEEVILQLVQLLKVKQLHIIFKIVLKNLMLKLLN